MQYAYDRGVRKYLLILAILSFAVAIYCALDLFYPFNGTFHLTSAALVFFEIALGITSINLVKAMPSLDPATTAKTMGQGYLIKHIFILISFLFMALGMPASVQGIQNGFPFFFFFLAMTLLLHFFLFLFFAVYTAEKISKGNQGLLPVCVHAMIGCLLLLAGLLYCLFSLGETLILIQAGTSPNQGTPFGVLALTIGALIFMLAIFLVTFFFSTMVFLAGKENRFIGFKGTLVATKEIATKYDVLFWFGILATVVLLVLAMISLLRLGLVYIGLVAMYVFTLIIKIPMYFWKKKIQKKGEVGFAQFCSLHKPTLYAGIVLFLYLVALYFVGPGSVGAVAKEAKSSLLTFGIFVPWAIAKIILGIRKLKKAKQKGDPNQNLDAYLDILVAFTTVTSTLFYVATLLREGKPLEESSLPTVIFYYAAVVLIFANMLYVLYIALRTVIVSIRGIRGKRLSYYETHFRSVPLEAKQNQQGPEFQSPNNQEGS